MGDFKALEKELRKNPRKWLVTGVAGFIGSHLAEGLLALGQSVTGLDNLSTGHRRNLGNFDGNPAFTFIEGDIRDKDICVKAGAGADYVLHHAAIASVPLSLENPVLVETVNDAGFINVMMAAHKAGTKRVVYASSSAVYGDAGEGSRRESEAVSPLSPYAVTKCANELYATALAKTHGIAATGLRYFNIYGARQDPNGAYAAVIPRWIMQMQAGQPVEIYGDGSTVRDFCFIGDVVNANIQSALSDAPQSAVYNIAGGSGTSLNDLFSHLKKLTGYKAAPVYKDFRAADIRISCADIGKARKELAFAPQTAMTEGLARTAAWYAGHG